MDEIPLQASFDHLHYRAQQAHQLGANISAIAEILISRRDKIAFFYHSTDAMNCSQNLHQQSSPRLTNACGMKGSVWTAVEDNCRGKGPLHILWSESRGFLDIIDLLIHGRTDLSTKLAEGVAPQDLPATVRAGSGCVPWQWQSRESLLAQGVPTGFQLFWAFLIVIPILSLKCLCVTHHLVFVGVNPVFNSGRGLENINWIKLKSASLSTKPLQKTGLLTGTFQKNLHRKLIIGRMPRAVSTVVS